MRYLQTASYVILMALLGSFMLGCSDDDDDNGNGNGTTDSALLGVWVNDDTGDVLTISNPTYTYEGDSETATFVPGSPGTPDLIEFDGDDWELDATDGTGTIVVGEVYVNEDSPEWSMIFVSATRVAFRETDPNDEDIYDESFAQWEIDNNEITFTDFTAGTWGVFNGTLRATPDQPTSAAGFVIDGNELHTLHDTFTSQNPSPSSVADGSPWTFTEDDNGEFEHIIITTTGNRLRFELKVSFDGDPNEPGIFGFSQLFEFSEQVGRVELYELMHHADYEVEENGDTTLTLWNVDDDMGLWSKVTLVEDDPVDIYMILVGFEAFFSNDSTLEGNDWTSQNDDELIFNPDGTFTVLDDEDEVIAEGRWRQDGDRVYSDVFRTYTQQ